MLARGGRLVFRGIALAQAGRDAGDRRVVIGVVKEHQRLPGASAPASGGGLTTRCRVETQASLVQRAIKSPRLTMKQPRIAGTSTHSPAALHTWRPPGLSSVARIAAHAFACRRAPALPQSRERHQLPADRRDHGATVTVLTGARLSISTLRSRGRQVHLHPQILRGRTRAEIQLAGGGARNPRGLHPQPAAGGLGISEKPIRRWRLLRWTTRRTTPSSEIAKSVLG
jgi:hypothetical protein